MSFADFLADYLNDKTFGIDPGPCPGPSKNGDVCVGQWDNLPPQAKEMRICLSNTDDTFCGKLGDLIMNGTFTIWQLQCKDVSIADIAITYQKTNANRLLNATVDASDVRLDCSGWVRIQDLVITIAGLSLIVTFEGQFTLDQTDLADGISLNLGVQFQTSSTTSFNTDLPEQLLIPYDECRLDPNLGLELKTGEEGIENLKVCLGTVNDCGFDIGFLLGSGASDIVMTVIISIAEAVMSGVVCQLLEEAAVLSETNSPGPLTQVMLDIKAQIDTWGLAQGENVAEADQDAHILATSPYTMITQAELDVAIDFNSSAVVEAVSVALNGWLGTASEQPKYHSKPVVNELVDLLTDPKGSMYVDLEALDASPEVLFPLDVTNATVEFEYVQLVGLSNISTFEILDVGTDIALADRYRRTFNNTIEIDEIYLFVRTFLRLERGDWVTESCKYPSGTCTSDASEFTFTFQVTVRNVSLEASVLAVIDPSQISDLQIGQLFDIDYQSEPIGAFSNAIRCISPAAYALNVTNLRASVGEIDDPKLTDFDGDGLSEFITETIELGTDLAKGALSTKFPGIANGPIRELINEVLLENVTVFGRDASTVCDAWQGSSTSNGINMETVDFQGQLFSPVYALVNEGVGGNPILDTEVDLNDLILTLLEYNEDTYADFPFTRQDEPEGSWRLKPEYDSASTLTAFETDDYLSFTSLTFGNVDSLYKLLLASTETGGLLVDFGIGGSLAFANGSGIEAERPFTMSVDFEANIETRGILEEAELELIFHQLDFSMELTTLAYSPDFFYGLTFSQLQYAPCLMAIVRQVEFRDAARKAAVKSLSFKVTPLFSASTNPDNKVSEALNLLATEQPEQRAEALVNTLLDASFDAILNTIEYIPDNLGEIVVTVCEASESLADILDNIPLGNFFPNFTEIIDECTGDIVPLPTILEAERFVFPEDYPSTVINVQESATLQLIRQGLQVLKGDTLEAVLTALANSSGSALADLFELENPNNPEDGNVTLVLPLTSLGLSVDLMDEFNPGFRAGFDSLSIVGFSRLLKSFNLLEPVGSLTTRSRVSFQDSDPVEIVFATSLELDGSAVGEAAGTIVREEVNVSIFVSDLELIVDVVSALNSEFLENLTFSQLLSIDASQSFSLGDHFMGCLFAAVYDDGLFIRSLELTLGELGGVSLVSSREILSEGMEKLVDAIVDISTYFYAEVATNIFQNCVREYINSIISAAMGLSSCPEASSISPPPLSGDERILRFSTWDALTSVSSFWFDTIVPEKYASVNAAVNAAFNNLVFFNTEASIGDQSFSMSIPLVYNSIKYGTVDLGIADVTITNLGSFSDLRLAVPFNSIGEPMFRVAAASSTRLLASPNERSSDSFEYITQTNILIDGPLEINGKFSLNATDLFRDYPNMVNQLDITLAVSDIELGLRLLLEIDLVDLMGVQFKSFGSISEIPCALVPVKALQPLDFNLSTRDITITVGCAGECDFPLINYLEDGSVFTNENGDTISELFDEFVEYVNGYLVTQGAQELINIAISQAEQNCAAITEIAEDLLTFDEIQKNDMASLFAYIFLGGCGVAGIVALALVPLHRLRERRQVAKHLTGELPASSHGNANLASDMGLLELRMKSLFQHPATPLVARYFIPFVQIMNVVGLVIAIGFSDAANITMSLTIFGAQTETVALVPFTLFSTINDTWNSGAWPLALLITVASCMWPIVKNLALLFLWFAPSTIVSAARRRVILEYLDMLGKWSFLDVFVIVITLAALRNYVVGAYYANLSFLDTDVLITDVNVTPENGLTLLCFVAALSLIINHIVLVIHDKIDTSNRLCEARATGREKAMQSTPAIAMDKLRIISYKFVGTTRTGQVRAVDFRMAKGLVFLLLLSFSLICAGISVPLITFELRGLLGLLLEVISKDSPVLGSQLNIKTYSVLGMGRVLGESATDTTWETAVIGFFKTMFAISVYVAPLLLLAMLAILFLLPMNLNMSKSVFFWTKINSYWSGLEIFLVAIILGLLELGIVTQFITDFITDDTCSQIKAAIELAVSDPEKDGVCFTIHSYLEPTSVLLFMGLSFQLVAFYIITVISSTVIADRNYAAYRNIHNDAKPKRMSMLNRWLLQKFTSLEVAPDARQSHGRGPAPVQGPFTLLEEAGADAVSKDFADPVFSCPCHPRTIYKLCCDFEAGQRKAEARIDAWHARIDALSDSRVQDSNLSKTQHIERSPFPL